MTLRIGSLFSGAGGLDMAVEAVFGGQVVWQSEIDKAASKVLAHRFPDVPNLGDITQVDWSNWKPILEVDILCGGFPCQDVSAAGKRAGIKDGTRSGLWAVFADAIDILRPPIVVIENVRGLLSAAAHRTVEEDDESGDVEPVAATMGNGAGRPVLRAAGAVLGDLADLGYDARWATVSAASVGAPHRRERVFIVAHAGNDGRPGETDNTRGWEPDVTGCRGGREPGGCGTTCGSGPQGADGRVDLLPTPRSSDCFGAGQHGDGGMDLRTTVTLLPTPNAQDGNGGGRYSGKPGSGHQSTLPGEVRLIPTHDREMPECQNATTSAEAFSANVGSQLSAEGSTYEPSSSGAKSATRGSLLLASPSNSATQWGKYEPAIRRWETLTRPAPAPTEPNKNGNPRLAASFSQWLMGWPDGWVTDPAIGISRNDQLRIVGNGVCSQQATAALRYLLQTNQEAV